MGVLPQVHNLDCQFMAVASFPSHFLPTCLVSCPDPSPKSGKRVWCSERLLLSHGAGSNGVKNVIIAFPHALHAACKVIPSCAVGTIALPVSNSVAPSIQHLPYGSQVGKLQRYYISSGSYLWTKACIIA